ncbi:hypothetical protein Tco_1067489 [Tanacetum coccineum]|uniref:Uncharacterized protein n=1 Tax=Tanacetum coccineum TaxID=301880 RepID=A0ABQ5HD40_9ASTR
MHDWSLRNSSRELKVLGGLAQNRRPRNLQEIGTFPPLHRRLQRYRSVQRLIGPLALASCKSGLVRRETTFHTEYGIRLMLAPRSAKALHVLIPENSHGIRNRPGSPSFFGNLLRMTAEQFSFNGVLAISLNFSLFSIKVFRVEANFGISIKASVKLISKLKSLKIS